MRTIKFRAWNGEYMEYGGFCIHATSGLVIPVAEGLTQVKDGSPVMQFTGLLDKNGKELYESDLVNVFFTSSEGEHTHDCIYKVSINQLYGITLTFVKLLWESYGYNQHTSSTRLTSEYRTLGEDYQNQNYDRLAVRDTWGENHTFKNRWKENDYSNHIERIGNIHENPELLTDD